MSRISKLGLGIIAFENFELLPSIIWEVRPHVDHITLCMQRESYHGDPIEQEDVKNAERLKEYGYVDDIIWFEIKDRHTDDKYNNGPRIIETDKRNFILDYLEKDIGCSHSMVIDSDEFYDGIDFIRAKTVIETSPEIKVSYCQYINYYRDYRHILVWPFNCYVPFITESSYRYDFYKGNFSAPIDPSRKYVIADPNGVYSMFNWNIIKMHHLSWIRLEIEKKLKSWSSRKKFDNANEMDKLILDRYYNYKDGQNAFLLFNVPENQVCVNKLNKAYIHPKFSIYDELVKYPQVERH